MEFESNKSEILKAELREKVELNYILSHQEVADLTATFHHFDKNGDGKITASELASVLRCLGDDVSDAEASRMIKIADRDGDECIDLREFLDLNAYAVNHSGLSRRKELEAVFATFDRDRNGFISAEELHSVMVSLGVDDVSIEDCCAMIRSIDADGDGQVNYSEFERLMLAGHGEYDSLVR